MLSLPKINVKNVLLNKHWAFYTIWFQNSVIEANIKNLKVIFFLGLNAPSLSTLFR